MKYDYDLVVLGQRPAAIAAAERAIVWGARVALVVSPDRPPATDLLAIAGVDVLRGCYEFYDRDRRPRRSRLGLQVREPHRPDRLRQLHSRRYLLVPDARVAAPSWPGLDATPHATIATAADVDRGLRDTEPGARAIVCGGRSLRGLELAIGLIDRGVRTRLITADPAILPDESRDPGAPARLWQLIVAARGLQCEFDTPIAGCKLTDRSEIQIATAEALYTVDRLFLTDRLVPDLDANAAASLRDGGVTFAGDRIWVDRHLRTAHPQVFACAAALTGYDAESIATHEALTATYNALVWRSRVPRYDAIAWGIDARPGYACVGQTEVQARAAGIAAATIDLCVRDRDDRRDRRADESASKMAARVVVAETGDILGATIVGDRAAEAIVPFSVAIGQRTSIDAWRTWSGVASGSSALCEQLCEIWRDRWWDRHPRWRERAKLWFDDRRR